MAVTTNRWLDLSFRACRLGLEAQTVIGLRMMKFCLGGPGALAEAELMVTEKAQAAVAAQAIFFGESLVGRHHRASSRTLALYRRKVRDNRRRLTSAR